MNIAIIDDEESCRKTLEYNLMNKCQFKGEIEQADGVEKGLSLIEKVKPDLVFLDVEMQDGTGFDLLSNFDKITFQVIFVTAYDKYAIQAFRYSATDFLLKPIEPQLLLQAFNKTLTENRVDLLEKKVQVLLENRNTPSKLSLPTTNGFSFVNLNNIVHIKAEDNYSNFEFNNGTHLLVCKSLKEYDELLSDNGFFRTHKSHLINLKYAESYSNEDGGYIIMENNSRIAVSRRKKDAFLKRMSELI